MAVLQMQRLNLVALKRNRKEILERLQEMGALEVDVRLDSEAEVVRQDTSSARALFEKNASLADQAIEILDRYAPEKSSLLNSLAGMPLIEHSEYDEVARKQREYIQTANDIISLDKNNSELNAGIQKSESAIEALVPWENLDVPMSLQGTKTTSLIIGMMPQQMTAGEVLKLLELHEPSIQAADVQIFRSEKDGTWLSVLCMKEDASEAENVLREAGFSRPSSFVRRTPSEEKQYLENQISDYQSRIQENSQEIIRLAEFRKDLKMVSDYYRLRAQKYEVLGTLPQTKNTFALSGYIPVTRAAKVAEELTTEYGAAVELEGIGEKEEAPVLLKNNKFADSVEGVLSSYGLPKKGEVDPTFIMSIFYVVLFGMMLSDAAYGAIVAIACGVVLLKFPRMDQGLRKSIKLFFFCGLSTLFWGIMFGSYFGDVVNVISRNYFGHEVTIPALWFVPLQDPMRLLIYSLLFGLIHMFIGMGLKGYMMLKQKDVVGFISDVVSWFMFLIGLILILLPTSIFESISNMHFAFPPFLNTLAKVLAVAGAVIILVMSGRRKKKNIGMRLAIGLYDLYGITSWLSDILSYSRLLALGLATGVIAQVINQMGSMFGTGVFGTIVFILVFIIGTVLNMAINLLGAYVHSNRLEFVEFFNKFYDGGGRPFEPFRTVTKYVEFKKSKAV